MIPTRHLMTKYGSPSQSREPSLCRHVLWGLRGWNGWLLGPPWRRGTWRHPPSFRVALAWLWWRAAWSPVTPQHCAWQAWHLVTSAVVSRGTRGTSDTCLALVTRLVPLGPPWRRATLRGRRGTWWHPPPFHVAGVALGDIHLRFARQAFHLWARTTLSHTHTHLYGKAFRILDLECNVRAKTNQNNTMKQMSMYICIWNTVDIDRINQQR